MNTFIPFKATILKEKPKNFEMSELNDRDMMFIKAIAIEEGVNGNNALFTREDLHRAKNSFVGKPLRILFDGENPTGHGFDPETQTFSDLVRAIGNIYHVEAIVEYEDGRVETVWGDSIPEGGTYQLVVYIAMWQKYYPEIALRLRQLHLNGELKFSIEAERDFEITPEGYRRCFNILFNGLAVVKNPAFENARSIIVAELLKEGGKQMEFKELYEAEVKKNTELAQKLKETEDKEAKTSDELAEVKEKLASATATIKEVEASRDTYKEKVEIAEKEVLGKERHAKLEKYGEVEQTCEELAELTREAFVDVLEKAVENYKPNAQENAEKDEDGIIIVPKSQKKENKSNKEKLLSFVEGLSK